MHHDYVRTHNGILKLPALGVWYHFKGEKVEERVGKIRSGEAVLQGILPLVYILF